MEKKNIIFIGFMGSGKTTLGKKTAKKLGYRFLDTDRAIEKKEGIAISQIFETKGEAYFRTLEAAAAKEVSETERTVVATGGGMIKNPSNMELLSKNGVVVYLQSTPERIYRNVEKDKNRPLLQGGDKMEKIRALMAERIPTYEKWAQVTIDVSDGDANCAVERIIEKLEGIL